MIALGPTTAEAAQPYLAPGVRLAVVPNPIEVPERVAAAGDQAEIVLFGGENGRVKGLDVLLDAWEAVRRARPRPSSSSPDHRATSRRSSGTA